jgi:hypothetical protein
VRDSERPARLRTSYAPTERPQLRVTWENVLPLLTGGQVVAGSNPVGPTVGPTEVSAGKTLFWRPAALRDAVPAKGMYRNRYSNAWA